MWAQCKDFISYYILTNDEQERDRVLGVSCTMIKPLGIGSVKVLVEDDQSDAHILHLHEVCHIPSLSINIFVPYTGSLMALQTGCLRALHREQSLSAVNWWGMLVFNKNII